MQKQIFSFLIIFFSFMTAQANPSCLDGLVLKAEDQVFRFQISDSNSLQVFDNQNSRRFVGVRAATDGLFLVIDRPQVLPQGWGSGIISQLEIRLDLQAQNILSANRRDYCDIDFGTCNYRTPVKAKIESAGACSK